MQTEQSTGAKVEEPINFWKRTLGRLIRWLIYVPLGLGILVLVQSTALLLFSWLFPSGLYFFIVGILFGGVIALPAMVMTYYLTFFLIARICPSPKVGMFVFGAIFYLFAISNMLYVFSSNQNYQLDVKHFIAWLTSCVIAAFALKKILATNDSPT